MKRLELLAQARADRAEVLAMIAAWRVSVGAGPDATPPDELAACLVVAEEEVAAAEAMASGDFEADAELLEELREVRRQNAENSRYEADWLSDSAGGHYGDA